MKIDKIESVMVEISNMELEKIVLDYLYRKHADLNTPKWDLEDFSIQFSVKEGDKDKVAVHAYFSHVEPVQGIFRDNKCGGDCSKCANTICR